MNESAEQPSINPFEGIKPPEPAEVLHTSPETEIAKLVEAGPEFTPERQPSPQPFPTATVPAPLPEIRYSFPERVRNVVFNRTNLLAAVLTAEGTASTFSYLVAKAVFPNTMLTEVALFSFLTPLLLWSGTKIAFRDVLPLGNFTSVFPRVILLKRHTPVADLGFGETYAEFHTGKNVGKMSDLSIRQRSITLAVDGLETLVKLASAIEHGHPKVAKFKAYKATSHWVGQYPELFQKAGFVVDNKKPTLVDKLDASFTKGVFFFV